MTVTDNDKFGLLKTSVDAHALGMSTIQMFLRQSGYATEIAPPAVMEAMTRIGSVNSDSLLLRWVRDSKITVLSFSYRLDPHDGLRYFMRLYNLLKEGKCLAEDGGRVKRLALAALPDTCAMARAQLADKAIYFPGDETAQESLARYGVPPERFPKAFTEVHPYDKALMDFATEYIQSERWKNVTIPDHYGYAECGTDSDTYVRRLEYCRQRHSLPIVRVHAGPYSPHRLEAVAEFKAWAKELAASRLLDVLSIGSSQLTQSHFGEDWKDMPNGGGVPVNTEIEYRQIAEAAKPMLTRTYAGTKDVPWMAQMHERSLNISWHALSLWWFCQLDGRGDNTVLENLREHVEAIRYIATTGKPLEPNVPHHFSFRGGDDVTYIVSAYLAAKTAKKYGIRHLILQNMLNTPKYTWGVEDVAKGRAMLHLVKSLEDATFAVSLQTRAGLDYFAPDLDKAKAQLAAVSALMDDIDPDNSDSPEIVHVVSYSEAVRLANPQVIKESIRITLGALHEYRRLKSMGKTYDTAHDNEVRQRYESLYSQAKQAIEFLEREYPNLYTPEGLYEVFKAGYLPVPYILDQDKKFSNATRWQTTVIDGAVVVVDDNGKPIPTLRRYQSI